MFFLTGPPLWWWLCWPVSTRLIKYRLALPLSENADVSEDLTQLTKGARYRLGVERVGKENYEQGGILLWPGFIPDSQSRALELKSRENRTEIFTSPPSRA